MTFEPLVRVKETVHDADSASVLAYGKQLVQSHRLRLAKIQRRDSRERRALKIASVTWSLRAISGALYERIFLR